MALNATMDYGSLLQLAKKTSDMKKQAKRAGPSSTPVRTPTENKNAEVEKKKLLDANVARFLAKRDAEERKRKLEADERREGLLAIRNKDSKARKRVKIMNKSAKSADKSAIEDAVGPSDYYVIEEPLCFMSQESLKQEEKFLEKLCKVPSEEIFAKKKANLNKDLSGTKDRVKMALLLGDTVEKKDKREAKEKQKENNLKEKGKSEKRIEIEEPQEEEKPRKPRQPRPPPMNYQELLKLAEKLQQEPVREAPKEKEPELRPMTTKERELYLLEEASRRRKEEGWKPQKKKVDRVSSSFQTSKPNAPAVKEEKSIPSIPRIPRISDSRPPAHDKKSDSYDERKSKSSREEGYGSSSHKTSQRPEERTPKLSRQAENSTIRPTAKHNSAPDRNHNDRTPREEAARPPSRDERSSQSKAQASRRDKEQTSATRLPSQQQGRPSSMSRDSKEAKPSSYVGMKAAPSSTDGRTNSKRPVDNSRNPTTLEKSKSQPKPPAPSNRQHPSNTHVPKKPPVSDPKSRNNIHNSDSKRCSPDGRPKSTETKSRQLPTLDSKSRNHVSETKSRSVTPSDSKPKHLFDVRAREPPSNSKPKQHPPTGVRHSQVSKSSPNDKSRNLPTSDVKSRNTPSSDVKSRTLPPSDVKSRTLPPSDAKSRNLPPSDFKSRNLPHSDVKSRTLPPSDSKSRNLPPSDVRPRNFPPSDVRPRNVPPSDVKSRSFPPSDVKPRKFPPPSNAGPKQFPPADVRRGPKHQAKKRRVIDSDDEYDSEVADFIDDGPDDDAEDYSKHIREIFGYDRSRYRGMDENDECMESSFSQQMKEEFKSTKLGIMEDLEDIRREKQREAMLKKKRRLK